MDEYTREEIEETLQIVSSTISRCEKLHKEYLEYYENTVLMEGHSLSEFLSENQHMLYTYDMGDNWEHEIQLTQVIEDYDKESPCLVEAIGQTPPEDVGGVGGYVNFREIMLDQNNPEYKDMKEWARFWTPELSDWEKRPRVIHL